MTDDNDDPRTLASLVDAPLPSGKDYISPSQISLVLSCGAKWRYKYVEGLDDPGSIATVTGTAMHAAVEAFLMTEDVATPEDASAYAREAFQCALQEERDGRGVRDADDDEAVAAAELQAGDLAAACVAWAAEHVEDVIAVEKDASYPLDADVRVSGRLDALCIIDGVLTLVDWKTAARSPSKNPDGSFSLDRKYAIQLLQYARALQEEGVRVERVAAVVVTKTKTVNVCPAYRTVTPEGVAFAERIARSALAAIRGEAFDPNPYGAGFLCSPVYCAFWSLCPGHDPADDPPEAA